MGGRNRLFIRAAATVAVLAVLAACSSGDDDDRQALERPSTTTTEGAVASGGGDEDAAIAAAEEFIEGYEALDEAGRESLELVGTRRSPGATHVRYRQVFDDIPVRAALLVVHVGDDGEVLAASDSLTDLRAEPGIEQQLDEAQATVVANKAVPEPVTETTAANVVWLPDGDGLRLGWSVQMATESSSYTVWVDAVTGEVADAKETRVDQAPDDCDVDADGPVACLFVPDPVSSSGTVPSLAEADGFRAGVELLGLDDPDSGALVGEFVDLESPDDSNPPTRETDGVFDAGRDDPGFEAVMAYFWIDAAQRLIQELGFDDVRNESFPVVPLESSEVDNAFYTPALDTIFLGVGSSGRPDAGEDAQVILHEYGHAVLHAQVPNMLLSDVGGAYHEGFGDIFAGLITVGLAQDPACLFPWFLGDFGPDGCGRRFDNDKVFPDDLVNEVHFDGEIFTGAVFDIFEALLAADGLESGDCVGTTDCDEVRDRVLTTALAANEFLTGSEDLAETAQAYVLANESAFGGSDAELFEETFTAHGLVPGGDGVITDGGEPTGEAPPVQVALDISHPFRGDLRITVQVVDAAFNDLCPPITLLDPNLGDASDNVSGVADVSDTDCAAFSPPAADRQWVLQVVDTAAADVGQVDGFAVLVDGAPFLATGVPAPIADDDPTGTAVIVNASGDAIDQEGTEAPGEGSDGVVAVAIEIAHTFVGDLQVRAGAADPATGDVLCSVPILEPDPNDPSDDVSGVVDMSACAEFFPPSPSATWFLEVVDAAAIDVGTIERFDVLGPDGSVAASAPVPVPIPDDDPEGGIALASG